MMNRRKKIMLVAALIHLTTVLLPAQGTAFTYQGRLNDGTTPANGAYDPQVYRPDEVQVQGKLAGLLRRYH